ncbi:MAG: 3-hydroxyacyl-ACP dehydratase [Bacteroidota bacterium]
MFRDSLFKITSINADDSTIVASVTVDVHSDILKGHFPGQPVVPGASMLQLVKEVLTTAIKKPLRLTKAENIKFLSLINPSVETLQLNISYILTDNEIKTNATLSSGDITCMKLQGTFIAL